MPQNVTLMLAELEGNAEQRDNLLLPVIRAYRGRPVHSRAGAVLVAFRSPTEAVLCGMAIQDRIHRQNHLLEEPAQLRAKVALHAGGVALGPEGAGGAAAQVVEAVARAAAVGEVVFTEAVSLGLERAEIQTEERGALEMSGAAEPLRLHRCSPAAEGLPFGGRDLKAAATNADALLALAATSRELAGVALERGTELLQELRRRGQTLSPRARALTGAGAALAAALVALVVWRATSLEHRVERELSDGQYQRALDLIEARGNPGDDRLTLQRARALHGLKQHRDEALALARIRPDAWNDASPQDLEGPLEDFARSEKDETFRNALGAISRDVLVEIAGRRDTSWSRWGAIRFLHSAALKREDELVPLYQEFLRSGDCRLQGNAAWHLGEIGAERALEALEALASTPKKQLGIFLEEGCGQDEARGAIRKIKRGKPNR